MKTAEVLARDRLLGSFSVSLFILNRLISFLLFNSDAGLSEHMDGIGYAGNMGVYLSN